MSQGNPSVARWSRVQYLTIDGNSDSVTLSAKTRAFSVYSTTDCWIKYGQGAQTAAAPGAEKTAVDNCLFVPASTLLSAIEINSDDTAAAVVAGIQSSAGGTLYVYEHFSF